MTSKAKSKQTKQAKQVIRIACTGTDMVDPDELIPFQGDLKTLTEKGYEKLKTSLLKYGWTFPAYSWVNGGKKYTIDAHQRLAGLELMKEEGIEVDGGKIPVVWILAKDRKAAKELCLVAASQYGELDEDSTYKFITESKLEWKNVKAVTDLPALNMGKLEKGWFDADFVPKTSEKEEEGDSVTIVSCPKCGHEWTRG